jgi:hypothetical protein
MSATDDFNPYAAPKADLSPKEPHQTEIWRDGRSLVVTRHSLFPARCIRCNMPTSIWCAWTLSWYEPSFLILSVSRSARLRIPLCPEHRRQRWWRITLGWCFYLGAFAFFGTIGAGLHPAAAVLSYPILIGVGLIILRRGLSLATIDHARNGVVWLSGASQDFLDELPEWPG